MLNKPPFIRISIGCAGDIQMIIKNARDVGIGTVSPATRLDVSKDFSSTATVEELSFWNTESWYFSTLII